MLAISCIAVPLVGCGPIHWLMLPGACRQCGVQGCTLHTSAAQGQGQAGDVVNPPRPRFHPVPTRPVFTAGFTPTGSPRGIPDAAQPIEQNDGPVDVNRRRERSIEPNPRENGDANSSDTDSSDTDSSDTDAASEDIPGNTARNRTAQRQPPREIASPKVERPVPAVKPMRYSQPQSKDENGLLWRRRTVGN